MPHREESTSWKIVQLAKEGKSDTEIAEIVGSTPEKVAYLRRQGAVSAENDRRYKYSEDDVDRIRHLRDLGWTYAAIAKEVGCSHTIAWAICNPEGFKAMIARQRGRVSIDPEVAKRTVARRAENRVVSRTAHTITPEIREKVLELYAQGVSAPEIGRRVDLAHSSVYKIIKQNNIPEEPQNTVADALDALDRD